MPNHSKEEMLLNTLLKSEQDVKELIDKYRVEPATFEEFQITQAMLHVIARMIRSTQHLVIVEQTKQLITKGEVA